MPRPLVYLAALLLLVGCGGNTSTTRRATYETIAIDPRQNTDSARRENVSALALMRDSKWPDAEAALKRSLDADIMFGPAHNNLGKVYFHQSKLYLAAWEFQYASKLMPDLPEPRNNLGLVYEAAGKLDDAADSYGQALAVGPDNFEVLGNSARVRVKRGERSPALRDLLARVVTHDPRPAWQSWARERLALMPAE